MLMKKILVTVMLVVAVTAAGAQDAAQPPPEQPRAASSQAGSVKDSAADDAHASRRDFRTADGTPPDKMDFEQWESILSKGSQADRNWVWNAIKGKAVQMRGTVIKATATEVDIAEAHNIAGKKADVTLTFEHPVGVPPKVGESIPLNFIPKEGASIDFQGVVSSYTRNPFVLTLEKGALLRRVGPSTAAHKPASQ
jgi:opacity protein-like surface antigen